MEIKDYKDLADIIKSLATALSFLIGGIWVYLRFIRQQEKYPNINFTADINVIGELDEFWVVELLAVIENKGKTQHKMIEFVFDVFGLEHHDKVELKPGFGNQVNFHRKIAKGSFLTSQYDFFFIDPGTTGKYSHLTRIPKNTKFIIYHTFFKYTNRNNYRHAAEKTIELKPGSVEET